MVRIRRVDEGASAGFMCIFSSGYLDSDRPLSTSPVLEMSCNLPLHWCLGGFPLSRYARTYIQHAMVQNHRTARCSKMISPFHSIVLRLRTVKGGCHDRYKGCAVMTFPLLNHSFGD